MKNTFLLLVFLLTVGVIYGQTPSTLSLQGVLREVSGAAAADGDYAMTFKIYDVLTGGTALWTETQSAVRVNNGVYSVQLGAVTALNLAFDKQYYIGVTVGGSELTPRMVLTAAPYALGFRGTQNVFGGGGNVGIGTLNPSAMLHVTGTSRFEGAATFTGTTSFGGNSTFPGTSTFDGKIISKSGDGWSGGIDLRSTSQQASASNFYWITRGFDDTDNRRHKMVFMVPNATDQAGAGYYFAENGSMLMTIDNGTGYVTAKGAFIAPLVIGTGVFSGGQPVMTTEVGVWTLSGFYESGNTVVNSVPSGISCARSSLGNYELTLPAGYDLSKLSTVQITPIGSDGANAPVMAMVKGWNAGTRKVLLEIRQTTNNSWVDHSFAFFMIIKK